MDRLDVSNDLSDDEIIEIIDSVVIEESHTHYLSIEEKELCRKTIFDSIRGYDILGNILEDNQITEIMINGTESIFVEKDGKIEKYDIQFEDKERLLDVIQQIVGKVNRRVNEAEPIVDTRLPDGSRVNVVLNPIAINGPILTIRKFPENPMTIDNLIEIGALTREAAEFIKILVVSKYNIFISGGTGSGKTTFLNALSNYIPSDERIITIEDSAELQIRNISNLVRLEVRQSNTEGENEVSIRDLIKSSLRMRPDRIVVGEVRGGEAIDMLSAMNTGHDGSLSTGHANSPKDMLSRLETMVLMGIDMPISAIRGQISSAIDIIIHLGRLRDKTRKVMEIVEVCGYKDNYIETNVLYRFEEEGYIKDKVKGRLIWSENGLTNIHKMKMAGYNEEAELYGKGH